MKKILLSLLMLVIFYPSSWEIMSVVVDSTFTYASIVAKDKAGTVHFAAKQAGESFTLQKSDKVKDFE